VGGHRRRFRPNVDRSTFARRFGRLCEGVAFTSFLTDVRRMCRDFCPKIRQPFGSPRVTGLRQRGGSVRNRTPTGGDHQHDEMGREVVHLLRICSMPARSESPTRGEKVEDAVADGWRRGRRSRMKRGTGGARMPAVRKTAAAARGQNRRRRKTRMLTPRASWSYSRCAPPLARRHRQRIQR